MTHKRQFRSIFISDVHLGTTDCQARLLLDFLESTDSEYLYLVGDIVDFWKLRNTIYWPNEKNAIANLLFEKAKSGTRVIYIPGNHDEVLRDFAGSHVNGIDIKLHDVHLSAGGKRLLVLHGDIFDDVVRNIRWLEALGSNLYDIIMVMSRIYNRARRLLGFSWWSFASFVKFKFKEAVRYIENFEATAARHAASEGYDGIICGHIHAPNQCQFDSTLYYNTGDWVEHCSALVESHAGNFSLVSWPEVVRDRRTVRRVQQLEKAA